MSSRKTVIKFHLRLKQNNIGGISTEKDRLHTILIPEESQFQKCNYQSRRGTAVVLRLQTVTKYKPYINGFLLRESKNQYSKFCQSY